MNSNTSCCGKKLRSVGSRAACDAEKTETHIHDANASAEPSITITVLRFDEAASVFGQFGVAILGPKDDPYGDLWVSERTGEEATRCPFVRKDRNRPTYRCTIYDTRPEVCRNYVPWSSHAICEEVVVDIPSPKGTPQKRPR